MSIVIRNAEVSGNIVDVRVEEGLITAVGPNLGSRSADVVEGRGGALIPGLHDHHIHLHALAASMESVDCSRSLSGLVAASGDGWIRGVGYHESVAGALDRRSLDAVVPHRPVRIQHRSGALWMLNSKALERVRTCLDSSPDVERDASGEPNGRLWRYDARLRTALPRRWPDLAGTLRRLVEYGVTGVTDATPDLDPGALHSLTQAADTLAEVVLLGAPTGHPLSGPRKLLLRDHDLPSYEELFALVWSTHAEGRPVAVHCVTAEALVLTLTVLREAGSVVGDRIEHGAMVPESLGAELARLGLAVVTQPSFLRLRGDSYLTEIPPQDHDLLYPFASLCGEGVRVAMSSDAPYGEPDPWQTIRDATRRATESGSVLGRKERVTAAVALAGFLGPGNAPGGPPRQVKPRASADLVLLDAPIGVVLEEPSKERVRAVLAGGRLVATSF